MCQRVVVYKRANKVLSQGWKNRVLELINVIESMAYKLGQVRKGKEKRLLTILLKRAVDKVRNKCQEEVFGEEWKVETSEEELVEVREEEEKKREEVEKEFSVFKTQLLDVCSKVNSL